MPVTPQIVLAAMTCLLIKHMIADFFLQGPYQFLNKGRYGHPGGLLHAGIHALLSLPVFWIIAPASLELGAAILSAEFLVHYHIDWAKENIVARYSWSSKDQQFWSAFGVDQFLHGLTYIAMVYSLL